MSTQRNEMEFKQTANGAGAQRSKLSRYAPLVACVCLILLASSRTFSASNTSRFVGPLLLWLFPDISEPRLAQVHFLIRKTAHFTEYAILAILAARAFNGSSKPFLRQRWWLVAFALVALVALVDEWHQSFLPSRTSSIYDSLLDITGGAFALACAAFWFVRRRKKIGDNARAA